MTPLPENLAKLRDDGADVYGSWEETDAFKAGYTACASELLPVIEMLRANFITARSYLESSGCRRMEEHEPDFQMLRNFDEALKQIDEKLEH